VTNEEQARYWNGDEAAHWLVHEERYERMLDCHRVGRRGTQPRRHRAGRRAALDGPRNRRHLAFLTSTAVWASLLRDAGPPTLDRVNEAVQAALEPYLTPDGLLPGSRAWLVTRPSSTSSVTPGARPGGLPAG
jgi:hypothetical protein